MNFILASIGIFIYLAISCYQRYVSEVNIAKCKYDYMYRSIEYNDWVKSITDVDLEKSISKYVIEYGNESEIYNKVFPIVNSFDHFDKEFKDDFEFKNYMICTHRLMIERILMALNGKLLEHDALFGIRSPAVYDSEVRKKWHINNDLMLWIDDKLHEHGIKHNVKFIDGACVFKYQRDEVDACDIRYNNEVIGGLYFWEPMKIWLPIY